MDPAKIERDRASKRKWVKNHLAYFRDLHKRLQENPDYRELKRLNAKRCDERKSEIRSLMMIQV